MPNCDATTGVAYGVIAGNHVPDLDQDIFENGNDESYKAWKEDTEASIRSALEDLDLPDHIDDERKNFADRYAIMEDALRHLLDSEGWDLKYLKPMCMAHADVVAGEFDIDKCIDDIVEHESQNVEIDEPEHTYQDGETQYLRSHLGGAALIWVIKSRYVTPCRSCSPCVPGAGSLDSCTTPENANNLAYCPPPSEGWIEELGEDERPYVIYHTDEKGFPTEEVAWSRPQA